MSICKVMSAADGQGIIPDYEGQLAVYHSRHQLTKQSEWFRDALMDLPPTCTKITLTAMPADTTHPPELLEATGSSNQRRYHRADVGGFSITAKGDFGQTDVSSSSAGISQAR